MGRNPLIGRLARLGAGRQDTEHEQALIRVGIAVAYLAYVTALVRLEVGAVAGITDPVILIGAAFAALSCGWVALIAFSRNVSAMRRVAAALADIAGLSAVMHYLGTFGVPLFPVYLWVAVGNGLRYGGRYLLLATGLALAGFVAMAVATPFWYRQPTLMAGMVLLLSVVPFYVWRLLRQLDAQRRHAQAANDAKSRFLANMSHELRTPLNAVIGLSHLLQGRDLTAHDKELVQDIHESAVSLGALVDEVLDFAKIEEARITLEDNPFDLYELLTSVWHMFRAQAAAKGLSLLLDVDTRLPFQRRGDASRLRQAMTNLVGNAVKFTDRGQVVIRLCRAQSHPLAQWLRLEVRDTGAGIAPQAQAYIFERFRQADDSTARRFGGTGLGTAIAKQLVELMGGSIGVQSSPGAGSCFWIELGLETVPASDHPVERPVGAEVLVYSVREEDAAVLEREFRAAGVAGATFCHSRQELVDALEWRPDREARRWVWVAAESCSDARVLALPTHWRRKRPDSGPRWLLLAADLSVAGRERALQAGYSAIAGLPLDAAELGAAVHLAQILYNRTAPVAGQPATAASRPQDVRILVGEDNRINQLVIRRVLERAGYRPDLVGSGAALLAELNTDRYPLAIVDIQMPDLSGLEAVRRYRAALPAGRRGTAVIVLTADATRESQQAAYQAGADYFLTKPVEPDRLLELVAAGISTAPAAPAGQAQ